MNIQLTDAPIAEKAVAPTRWAIFSLWVHTPEEIDVEFTQRIEIVGADGEKFADATTKFKTTTADDLQSKNHLDVLGIPIWREGFVKVKIWLDGVADSSSEYQFFVKYLAKETNAEAAVVH